MKTIFGETTGLKPSQIKRLEAFYRKRIPPMHLLSWDMARDLCALSAETGKQIGVLVDRQGRIAFVLVGDHERIVIPELKEYRRVAGRLCGLRFVHTHFSPGGLTTDDLTDLSLLRLDLIAVITLQAGAALPHRAQMAHILPGADPLKPYRVQPLEAAHSTFFESGDCLDTILAIEAELVRQSEQRPDFQQPNREAAILVSVSTGPKAQALESLDELEELATSSGIKVADRFLQVRSHADPRFLLGAGKLQELTLKALHHGVGLLIFDQELNPSQLRSITDAISMKVIDRTQLILDLFAQRARSREGKLQVELAQLKYMLPRLVTKNTAMSRLTGGIGGRGPGETKLEINRRRARERIHRLEQALIEVSRQRKQQKSQRSRMRLPIISIIGYTNAGKSTLLNTLTHSQVLAEQRMFATLDPSSRRLRFPQDIEAIITDTVGFIKDLPKDLQVAFRATLEELESATILLHVIDISNERCESQLASVERIVADLGLNHIPMLRIWNKIDRVHPETVSFHLSRHGGIPVSAIQRKTLVPLIETLTQMLDLQRKSALSEDRDPILLSD
ncbi:GTPase HflX [Desulfatirhabdium butyrativorans]|uniref:GTPase HflX n=1 Tax=Desulfatirhabdium butyrativorans TaxID=340467 RepID=UPI0003F88DC2|nr:GTPase HflX [Desulfatirhabdium butyrativorans]